MLRGHDFSWGYISRDGDYAISYIFKRNNGDYFVPGEPAKNIHLHSPCTICRFVLWSSQQ